MAIKKGLQAVGGAVLFAAVMWAMLAGPGFTSDQASTMPVWKMREARR